MKTISRSARLAVGVALVGALAETGWSQGVPRPDSPPAEPQLFASVHAYKEADIPALEKYFLASLEFPSNGVVESALREIIRVKLAQPSVSSESLAEKFRDLAAEGNTPAIRYKAVLGVQVFENASLFLGLADQEFKSDDEMFTAISRQLEKSLLAHNF